MIFLNTKSRTELPTHSQVSHFGEPFEQVLVQHGHLISIKPSAGRHARARKLYWNTYSQYVSIY